MRILAGVEGHVRFTHLSKPSCSSLESAFSDPANGSISSFSCHKEGVLEIMQQSGVSLDKVCLLDPKAEKELSPEDGDGRFQWFLFGVCGC